MRKHGNSDREFSSTFHPNLTSGHFFDNHPSKGSIAGNGVLT